MSYTTKDLKEQLRKGPYAWPGGYPCYFITDDGAALSFDSVRENLRQVIWAIRHKSSDGWRVIGCEVNWEDSSLYCDHSGKRIESAYAEREESDFPLAPESVPYNTGGML
jgi:hypothetical protein